MRKFDSRVPYNFDNKESRPFVGVLFKVDKYKYFAPLSSLKQKHLMLKDKIDFLKLDKGKLGAINFNNMLPVTDNNIIILDLDKKPSDLSEKKYNKLLKEQIYWLNRNNEKLYSRSKKLYDSFVKGKLPRQIRNRCCDFILLEEKCKEYDNG